MAIVAQAQTPGLEMAQDGEAGVETDEATNWSATPSASPPALVPLWIAKPCAAESDGLLPDLLPTREITVEPKNDVVRFVLGVIGEVAEAVPCCTVFCTVGASVLPSRVYLRTQAVMLLPVKLTLVSAPPAATFVHTVN